MTPAFGFSVGDFINALDLVRKVVKALHKTGGASSQYQLILHELNALYSILQALERLEPTEENASQVNAIRGMALACQLPLRDFLAKLEKYENSLSPFSTQNRFRAAGRKTQWAVTMDEEIEKLRASVVAKVISISSLLQTHAFKISQERETRRQRDHSQLIDIVHENTQSVNDIHTTIKENGTRASESLHRVAHDLATVKSTTETTQSAVASLRSIGQQVASFIGAFHGEIRDLLGRIVRGNFETYNVLLAIQRDIAATPTDILESNIIITDALDRVYRLQFEPFCNWDMIEAFMIHKFKGLPGERSVSKGHYHFMDERRGWAVVDKDQWTQNIFPGSRLSMSIILAELHASSAQCPRNKTHRVLMPETPASEPSNCLDCGLVFWSSDLDVASILNDLQVSDEPEAVSRRQMLEDIQSFGSRNPPVDVTAYIGKDSSGQFLASKKVTEVHGDPSAGRQSFTTGDQLGLAHSTRSGQSGEPVQEMANMKVTAIDWNSGSNPMDAWLNQSAIPTLDTHVQEVVEEGQNRQTILEQEQRDLEHLQKVHLCINADMAPKNYSTQISENELNSAAWPYHRKILDRFPNLPAFLARRLAEANVCRSNRLKSLLNAASPVTDQPPLPLVALEFREASNRSPALQSVKLYPEPEPWFSEDPVDGNVLRWSSDEPEADRGPRNPGPPKQSSNFIGENKWSDRDRSGIAQNFNPTTPFSSLQPAVEDEMKAGDTFRSPPHPAKRRRVDAVEHHQESKKQRGEEKETIVQPSPSYPDDLYGQHKARRSSVCSNTSSRNSSLRGDQNFDMAYQTPTFSHKRSASACSSYDIEFSSAGLPPPPAPQAPDLMEAICDLCGKKLKIRRQRDWQRHLMRDLKPYVCLEESCEHSSDTFHSYARLIKHMQKMHSLSEFHADNSSCIFCGTLVGFNNERHRHLGKHMEEVAFSVVPRIYEDWSFYSDSGSSGDSSGKENSKKHPDTLATMNNLAGELSGQGKYEQSEEMYRKALWLQKRMLGKEHPDTLTSMNNLATVLRDQGKYKQAEEMHRQALKLKKIVLGEEHPDTLTSMKNLAGVLRRQGKYEQAEEMHRQALRLYAKVLGQEHPDTLMGIDNLAIVLSRQGKYEQAEGLHRQVLRLYEKMLGKEHLSTLMSMNNLAAVLSRQGKYEQAEEMHRQALGVKKKILGKEHPDTLTSMNNLATVLSKQGKYEQAEEMHRQGLKLYETVLGKEHPDTLMSMNNLAAVLSRQDKYEQAEGMHRQALRLKEKMLGTEHPSTLTSMNNLAIVLSKQDKHRQAEEMHRQGLGLYETVLGKAHPDTLMSMNNLAAVLSRQNKHKQAEEIHRQTLRLYEKMLGEEHPDTLMSMNNLATVLGRQGKYEQAEEIHRQALRLKERMLGTEHPSILASMNNLAMVLSQQGKYEQAEEMHRQGLGLYETMLGKEHPDILTSVYCLAYLLHLKQQLSEAGPLYQRALTGYEKTLGSDHPTTQACRKHYLSMAKGMDELDTEGLW